MLTIFSVPKPFAGHIGLIQRNAVASWTRLSGGCEIVLFGAEAGVAEAAREFNVAHVPQVEVNEFGTPLLNSIFAQVRASARHWLICYVNADIILMEDFLEAIRRIHIPRFLAVGQRWNLDLRQPLAFERPGWADELRQTVKARGVLQPPSGSDYFVFPRDSGLALLLPFAVGRPAWDNWFIYEARRQRIPVIDATAATTVIHQNHDYAHVGGRRSQKWEGPEADANRRLIGGWERVFTLADATHLLTDSAIRPAWGRRYLARRWETLPALWPALAPAWRMRLNLETILRKAVSGLRRRRRSVKP